MPTPPDKRPRALEIDSSWRLSPTSDKPELPPIIDSATFSLHIPFPYSAFAEHQRAGLVVVEFDTRRFPAACPVFGYDATARRALVQFICGVAARCVGTASREGVAAEVVAAWKTLLAAYGLRFASCMTLAARHTLQRITGTLVCESTQMLAGGESVAQFHSRCGPALDASHRESFWSGLIGSAPPAVVMAWLNSSECRDPLAAVNLFCSPTWGEDAPAVTLFPFHQFPRYMLTALAPLRQTEVGLGRLTTGPQPVLDYSTSRIVPMLLREGVSATITSRLRAARALMHSHYVCIKSRSTTVTVLAPGVPSAWLVTADATVCNPCPGARVLEPHHFQPLTDPLGKLAMQSRADSIANAAHPRAFVRLTTDNEALSLGIRPVPRSDGPDEDADGLSVLIDDMPSDSDTDEDEAYDY